MSNNSYFEKRNNDNNLKLKRLKQELPYFCSEFFLGIEHKTTPLTRLGYAQDLKIFFAFLSEEIVEFKDKKINEYILDDLNKITATHLEIFLDFLNVYYINGKQFTNNERSKSRKLSTVRSFLKYFFKKGKIISNVSEKVDLPKIHDKEIIRLEVDEVVKILDLAENGDNLSPMEKGFHKHTKKRDFALLSLFLGTGIRISECVGLNVDDIDFNSNAFTITRKGGNRVILYFSDEVALALADYIEYRATIKGLDPNEPALFISLQKKRMGVRSVEKLVKKYAKIASPLKKITPHKLRSTYGTNLYRETGDIYVVADVLGHKDVNTTKKHYAAISEDIRKSAANKVKLRK